MKKITRSELYEFIFENSDTIMALPQFLRYVKILLDENANDLHREFNHLRLNMAQKIGIHDRTLGRYEEAWHANNWLEQANPKNGLPQSRKFGQKIKALGYLERGQA